MVQEKQKFDVANLTEEEKAIRQDGIQVLFEILNKGSRGATLVEAQDIYDQMQDLAVQNGKSEWTYYKKTG